MRRRAEVLRGAGPLPGPGKEPHPHQALPWKRCVAQANRSSSRGLLILLGLGAAAYPEPLLGLREQNVARNWKMQEKDAGSAMWHGDTPDPRPAFLSLGPDAQHPSLTPSSLNEASGLIPT